MAGLHGRLLKGDRRARRRLGRVFPLSREVCEQVSLGLCAGWGERLSGLRVLGV